MCIRDRYWTDNSSSITAQSTDRLMVAVIFDNEPYTPVLLEDTNTLRKDGYARVTLPEGEWQTAHLYLSLIHIYSVKPNNKTPPRKSKNPSSLDRKNQK